MSPQSTLMPSGGFQLGIRKQEGVNSPLKVSKDSHRIRKPPLPLPQVQYRPPIIIHMYSPKVIHTEPDDFMSLVQKLTGSSDTRLRLKKSSTSKKEKQSAAKATASSNSLESATVAATLERQGSESSSTINCGSPTVSEDSSFLVSGNNEGVAMKQSDSPRSPLDSHFEFDNVSEAMFSHFDVSSGSPFSPQQVKAEPMFAFNDNNPFSFFGDFMQPTSRVTVPVTPPMSMGAPLGTVMDQMHSSSGFGSPNLMNHGLPELPPSWSQSFLDQTFAPAPSYNQAVFPRQRFSGVYAPSTSESSTMVALENIHTFMLT